MTSKPCVAAHMRPQIADSGKIFVLPSRGSTEVTLTDARRTLGATPTMPTPLSSATISPAVNVPWPFVSKKGSRPVASALLIRNAPDTRGAVGEIDIVLEVRMRVVDTAVEVTDED